MSVGFSYTRFGYRQNSRTHVIVHLRWLIEARAYDKCRRSAALQPLRKNDLKDGHLPVWRACQKTLPRLAILDTAETEIRAGLKPSYRPPCGLTTV